MSLLFVYGTLKQGECRAHYLNGQTRIGTGITLPKYRLFRLDGYPGLVEVIQGLGISGEVWEIDPECRYRLDEVEGVDDGQYQRRQIELAPPFDDASVEAYFYLGSVAGCEECGSCW